MRALEQAKVIVQEYPKGAFILFCAGFIICGLGLALLV